MSEVRLIDANALMEVLGIATECKNCKSYDGFLGCKCDPQFVWACEAITDAPAIDPVKHGRWIRKTDTRFGPKLNDLLICSECNIAFSTGDIKRRSYCPNCGARMDGEENGK